MKRSVVTFFCFFVALCGFAQVSVDKVEPDGSRILLTKDFRMYDFKLIFCGFGSLSFTKMPDGRDMYCIFLTLNEGEMTIDKGRKLLLKFKDETVMELENVKDIELIDNKLEHSRTTSYYLVSPQYPVTKEQLEKIMKNEVIKLRIENDVEFLDRTIKKNRFSQGIKKAYEDIHNKVKSTNNSLYEGF